MGELADWQEISEDVESSMKKNIEKCLREQAWNEKKVDDLKAASMATDIAGTISEKLTFPGQIRVTVIREFSAIEFAS